MAFAACDVGSVGGTTNGNNNGNNNNGNQTAATVTAVVVSPETAAVEKGKTQAFTAAVAGTNSPSQSVTWSIVQTGKKAGTAISASGLLTIAADEALEILTVKATSTQDSTRNGMAAVIVKDPTLKTLSGEVSISPSGDVAIGTLLTAIYTGVEAVSFQWEQDGIAVDGATDHYYYPPAEGSCIVIASAEGYNKKPSAPVTVSGSSVNDPSVDGSMPKDLSGEITISPSDNVTTEMTLTANYSGSETVSYQWYSSSLGTIIEGATGNTYTPTIPGTYYVVVSATGYDYERYSNYVSVRTATPTASPAAGNYTTAQSVTLSTSTAGANIYYTINGSTPSYYDLNHDSPKYTSPITISQTRTLKAIAGYKNEYGHIYNSEVLTVEYTIAIPVFTDAASFAAYLSTANGGYSKDDPIPVKLNVATLPTNLRDTIKYSGKYVSLDLSGSTFTSIGREAFDKCDGLTSVIIPDSVTRIGDDAFWNCQSLVSVVIPNSVTSIGINAFSICQYLTSITIPASVTSIGDGAFFLCDGITAFTVDAANAAYSSENGILYNKTKTTLMYYPAGKTGSSFTIPNSVTSIEDYAFARCNLTSVTFQGTIPAAGFSTEAFDGDLRDKYLAGGPGTYTRSGTGTSGSPYVWTKQ